MVNSMNSTIPMVSIENNVILSQFIVGCDFEEYTFTVNGCCVNCDLLTTRVWVWYQDANFGARSIVCGLSHQITISRELKSL